MRRRAIMTKRGPKAINILNSQYKTYSYGYFPYTEWTQYTYQFIPDTYDGEFGIELYDAQTGALIDGTYWADPKDWSGRRYGMRYKLTKQTSQNHDVDASVWTSGSNPYFRVWLYHDDTRYTFPDINVHFYAIDNPKIRFVVEVHGTHAAWPCIRQ